MPGHLLMFNLAVLAHVSCTRLHAQNRKKKETERKMKKKGKKVKKKK
jgi:hypothetical protein